MNPETLKSVSTILSHVRLLRATDNLDPDEDQGSTDRQCTAAILPPQTASEPLWIPDEDKTMNRLKKSINDEANAVSKDQDNFMMEGIMNVIRSLEPNATNRGEKMRILNCNL